MTRRIDIVRCWWCEKPMSTDEALIDRRTGKVKCPQCLAYDQAVEVTR
jgi:hypothetical protein